MRAHLSPQYLHRLLLVLFGRGRIVHRGGGPVHVLVRRWTLQRFQLRHDFRTQDLGVALAARGGLRIGADNTAEFVRHYLPEFGFGIRAGAVINALLQQIISFRQFGGGHL